MTLNIYKLNLKILNRRVTRLLKGRLNCNRMRKSGRTIRKSGRTDPKKKFCKNIRNKRKFLNNGSKNVMKNIFLKMYKI
jgi:ribosomal protein L19E